MIANNIIPIIFLLIIVYGMFKGRKVYEWFLEGAKEGLMVCVKIFPALLAMMIAIRIFKDANLLNYLNNLLDAGYEGRDGAAGSAPLHHGEQGPADRF